MVDHDVVSQVTTHIDKMKRELVDALEGHEQQLQGLSKRVGGIEGRLTALERGGGAHHNGTAREPIDLGPAEAKGSPQPKKGEQTKRPQENRAERLRRHAQEQLEKADQLETWERTKSLAQELTTQKKQAEQWERSLRPPWHERHLPFHKY